MFSRVCIGFHRSTHPNPQQRAYIRRMGTGLYYTLRDHRQRHHERGCYRECDFQLTPILHLRIVFNAMHTSVLLFPAVKKLCMVSLLVLLVGWPFHYVRKVGKSASYYNDHIRIALRDIPVGTALQPPDFRLDHGWTPYDEGACLSLPSKVLGHKTLRPIVKGETIRVIDIEGTEGWKVSHHIPNPRPEDVADGWSAWQY